MEEGEEGKSEGDTGRKKSIFGDRRKSSIFGDRRKSFFDARRISLALKKKDAPRADSSEDGSESGRKRKTPMTPMTTSSRRRQSILLPQVKGKLRRIILEWIFSPL